MDEPAEECMQLFIQDGVLLKETQTYYMSYMNQTGSLYITEYLNSNTSRYIEWKPNDTDTIDSDFHDQEWAVVETIKNHSSSSMKSKSKYIKINLREIHTFKVSKKNDRLQLSSGSGDTICSFFFQHGNCSALLSLLRQLIETMPTKRDKLKFICLSDDRGAARQLDRSFAELDLFTDSPKFTWWNLVSNIQPYETTFQAFSKIADIVTAGPNDRPMDEQTQDILNRSLTELESSHAPPPEEYEVVQPELPSRKDYPRGGPLTAEQWKSLQDNEGRVEDIEFTKLHIFRGGVHTSIRGELWKYLLEYYPWNSTHELRKQIQKQKKEEYYGMKLQWKTITKSQEENFADYRERKSLIEKDVNRTDRNMPYYAGDNNPNLQTLYEILMTYVMYNFDLGYVQGMSDLLSPILHLLDNEVDAFWCFVGFMDKVSSNFDIDQAGMKEQLENLHTLLSFVNPQMANYLDRHDSGNMFFCFRWLLVWFKRELSEEDVMQLWEVLWTGLPCQNFHLLICVSILEAEKTTLMENGYGFTEILKHINDLSGQLDINTLLNRAEGIYNQVKTAEHLTDPVRIILGLPILNNSSPNDSQTDSIGGPCSLETLNIADSEIGYEHALQSNFL